MCTELPDACSDATRIALDSSGRGSVSGSFANLTQQYTTICEQNPGADAVYFVDVPGASDVTIDTEGSEADTVLAAALNCGNLQFGGLGCNDNRNRDEDTSRLWLHRTPAGDGDDSVRIYIMVQAASESEDDEYRINVRTRTAAPDQCTVVTELLNVTDGGTLVGFIPARNDTKSQIGSCQRDRESEEQESVVSMIGNDRTMRLTAVSSSFPPDLHVRTSCPERESEVACIRGSARIPYAARLDVETKRGQRYVLFVDGASSAGGTYSLQILP